MPVDACQFYYACGNCKTLLRPNPRRSASSGSVKCLPIQPQGLCGAAGMHNYSSSDALCVANGVHALSSDYSGKPISRVS
nr:hypothetical protein [Pseudomonas sp. UBA2684]